jgi:cytochrome b561
MEVGLAAVVLAAIPLYSLLSTPNPRKRAKRDGPLSPIKALVKFVAIVIFCIALLVSGLVLTTIVAPYGPACY